MNRDRSRTWLVLVLAAAAVILLLLHEGGQLQPIENVVNTLLGPIERAALRRVCGIGNLFGAVREFERACARATPELEKQNQDLLTEIAGLAGWKARTACCASC